MPVESDSSRMVQFVAKIASVLARKAGAALAAGCTTVWKPAGETPLSALAYAALAEQAGFPKGTINVVLTLEKVAEVGEALCKSKSVRKLSFTGSTRVGKLLARQCSNNLTKLSLERKQSFHCLRRCQDRDCCGSVHPG